MVNGHRHRRHRHRHHRCRHRHHRCRHRHRLRRAGDKLSSITGNSFLERIFEWIEDKGEA